MGIAMGCALAQAIQLGLDGWTSFLPCSKNCKSMLLRDKMMTKNFNVTVHSGYSYYRGGGGIPF